MTDLDKKAFAEAMAALCLGMREKDPDAHQMKTYFAALKDLDIEFVVLAVPRLLKNCQYFPKPAEWYDAAEAVMKARRDDLKVRMRLRIRAGLPPLCVACNDCKWVYNEDANAVKPCDCQKLRWLEILGRRPMPELPAGPEAA